MLHCTTNNLVIGNAQYYILIKSVYYHKETMNKEKKNKTNCKIIQLKSVYLKFSWKRDHLKVSG